MIPVRWTRLIAAGCAEAGLVSDLRRLWPGGQDYEPADSQAWLRLALEAGEIGTWDWDLRTNQLTYSAKAKTIFGFPPDQPVTFEQVRAATHPEDLPQTTILSRRARDPAIRAKEPYEYRLIRADGETRWVLAHGEAIFEKVDGVEQAVRYLGTIQDITERREREASLRASEARLRLAVDAARLGVWDYETATDTIKGSPELNRILGFPPDHPLDPAEVRARYYPGERERVQAAARTAFANRERYFQIEYRYLVAGVARWLLLRAELLFNPNGSPSGALGVVMDITERREAEERQSFLLRELEHRVKNTLAAVQGIVFMSLSSANDLAGGRKAVTDRLNALSNTHDVLMRGGWGGADIKEIAELAVAPFKQSGERRILAAGPPVKLSPEAARGLSIVLNELVTNALKYGSLSQPSGLVHLNWTISSGDQERQLRLVWEETGGPPVAPPTRRGFGTRIIETGLAGGTAELQFAADGVRCTLTFPLHE